MVMTTTGAGSGLMPAPMIEVTNMDRSKEAELMATYKLEIVKPVFVRGEIAKPETVVEGLTRAERDNLLCAGAAKEVTGKPVKEKPENGNKSKDK